MPNSARVKQIREIVERIEKSPLSAEKYIQRYTVPFSLAQFYRYKARISSEGEKGLKDKRDNEHRRKLNTEQMGFIRGLMKSHQNMSLLEIQQLVCDEFEIKIDISTISRVLKKLGIFLNSENKKEEKKEQVSCAGFEIIAALAIHLGWVEHTTKCIKEVIDEKLKQHQPSGRPEKKRKKCERAIYRRIQ